MIFNHLPIDARANDAEILLTKGADQRSTSIGSLVRYTVTVENLKQVPAFDVEVVDTPPAGFSFVTDSALLTKSGPDATFNTSDDVTETLATVIQNTLTFETIDLDPEEIVQINYVTSCLLYTSPSPRDS